jgi:hypothetical protein
MESHKIDDFQTNHQVNSTTIPHDEKNVEGQISNILQLTSVRKFKLSFAEYVLIVLLDAN